MVMYLVRCKDSNALWQFFTEAKRLLLIRGLLEKGLMPHQPVTVDGCWCVNMSQHFLCADPTRLSESFDLY